MFLSIFTDELGKDVTEALPVIREWGLERCDLRGRIFGKGCERLTDEEIADLKKLLAEHGLAVGAFQSSLAKVHLPDAERQKAEFEKLEGLIRAADALDCRLVRSFNYWQPPKEQRGALAVQPDQMQQVLDMFGPVARRAQEAGLVLAFENCGQTVAEVVALVEALGVPGWGLAWDASNGWDTDERRTDEVEYIVKNARRAKMLHVKAKSIVPEIKGSLPWDRVLAACAAAGLEGPVSVETHNPAGSGFTGEEMSRLTCEAVRRAWPTAAPGDIYAEARGTVAKKVERAYEDNPVGFVMVGLGMGHGRAKGITKTPGTRLVGVCDLREERAQRSGEAYGVKFTTDLKPWLSDPEVEVVYVVTETGRHAEVGLQALAAGKHVVTTKPMEASLAACDEMISSAEERDRVLAVDFGRRFESDLLSLRKAVADGFFGRMLGGTLSLKILRTAEYFLQNGGWRGTRRWDGGGVLSNQCIHEIDTVVFCLGPPERVRCDIWTQTHDIEAEDLGCATWAYADGAVIHLYATTSYPQKTWYSRLELHGTGGAFVGGKGGPATGKSPDLWFSDGEWRPDPPVKVESDWLNAADNMAAAVRTGAELVCTGRDGRRSQAVLDAMYRSAYDNGGGWVEVKA
jgi:predicted dehydrogenase/sugar phosphate isomerase/epimerase